MTHRLLPLPDLPEMRQKENVDEGKPDNRDWFSPWMAEPCEPQAPLEDALSTDVAIIGAGYTGLSAAIAVSTVP